MPDPILTGFLIYGLAASLSLAIRHHIDAREANQAEQEKTDTKGRESV